MYIGVQRTIRSIKQAQKTDNCLVPRSLCSDEAAMELSKLRALEGQAQNTVSDKTNSAPF
jgi:hypothetical protein